MVPVRTIVAIEAISDRVCMLVSPGVGESLPVENDYPAAGKKLIHAAAPSIPQMRQSQPFAEFRNQAILAGLESLGQRFLGSQSLLDAIDKIDVIAFGLANHVSTHGLGDGILPGFDMLQSKEPAEPLAVQLNFLAGKVLGRRDVAAWLWDQFGGDGFRESLIGPGRHHFGTAVSMDEAMHGFVNQ